MFEDRTAENILQELLSRITGVNTNEGSLSHMMQSSNAETFAEVYVAIRYLKDQLCISTMDLEHLIQKGETEKGVMYEYATGAVYEAVFNCEMSINDIFTKNEFTFVLTERLSDKVIDGITYYRYKVSCKDTGTKTNNCFGIFDSYLGVNDNYDDEGTIISLLVPGSDDEEVEVYRGRLKEKYKAQEFAGNTLSYITTIKEIKGVLGVKPIPRTNINDAWTYKIYILAEGGTVPSNDLITTIQNIIDPSTDINDLSGIYGLPQLENTSGKGYGLAPCDHIVAITAVNAYEIDVSVELTLLTDFTFEDVREQIEKIIDSYFNQLITSDINGWQSNTSIVVKRSEILSGIISAHITGIDDVTDVQVNNNTTIEVPYTHIPVRGSVINV